MWERAGQQEEVAVYVRNLVGKTNQSVLLRQQEALGLSQPGLARRRWRIEEVAEPTVRTNDPDRASAKTRFTTIEGGATRSA